ncbi:Serine protease 56, partial [Halocaridina rubra]
MNSKLFLLFRVKQLFIAEKVTGGGNGSGGGGGGGSGGGGNTSSTSQPSKCGSVCGKDSNGTGVTRIVGGTVASKGEYPWLVLVKITAGGSPMQCGGSLVTTTHAVTAAHCLEFSGITEITVTAGEHDVSTTSEATTQFIEVTKSTQHPQYDPNSQDNDIAVLTLGEPVKWTDNVAPICLGINQDHTGTLAVVAGWGTLSY